MSTEVLMSLELLVGVQVPVSGGGEGGEEQSTTPALFSSCHCLAQLELQLQP